MTSTSFARHSFYVHHAQIYGNDEPATSHSQSKGSNSHSNSARSPLLKAEISDTSNECRKLCSSSPSPQLTLVSVGVTNQGEICTGHVTRLRHSQGGRAAIVCCFQTNITTKQAVAWPALGMALVSFSNQGFRDSNSFVLCFSFLKNRLLCTPVPKNQ